MIVTNNTGLPLPLVRAVTNDPYDNAGTRSVTTLLKPPQMHGLTFRHKGEITEDAADRIWSLVGQVGHTILERAAMADENYISEERFHAVIDGEPVSGQVDLIDKAEGTVFDFKFTGGYAVARAMEEGKGEWQLQLSLLALLARLNGVPVTTGKIIAIVRDWTKYAAQKNRGWPEKQVAVLDMNILSHDETLDWVKHRIGEHVAAEEGDWRPCTDEERWYSPGKWAVHKRGKIKAEKLEDTEVELDAWIFKNQAKVGSGYRIEQRPSEYKRCAEFCSASPYCKQFQSTRVIDEQGV